MLEVYKCQGCSKVFDTSKECAKHEKECDKYKLFEWNTKHNFRYADNCTICKHFKQEQRELPLSTTYTEFYCDLLKKNEEYDNIFHNCLDYKLHICNEFEKCKTK